MDIKVAVMCRNASGEPEIVASTVTCTQDEYDNGTHYDRAADEAREKGYEPVMSFDEHDPAWQATGWGMLGATMPGESSASQQKVKSWLHDEAMEKAAGMGFKDVKEALDTLHHQRQVLATAIRDSAFNAGICSADVSLTGPDLLMLCGEMSEFITNLGKLNVYKQFFDEAVLELQDTFLEGKEANSESLTNVGNLITRYLNQDIPEAGYEGLLYFAFGPAGYWSDGDGYGERADEATFSSDVARHNDCLLDGAVVVGLTLDEIDKTGLLGFPSLIDLQDAADQAIERARQYEFAISTDNAAEVMREELASSGNIDISLLPQNFNPVLSLIMLAQIDAQTQSSSTQPSQAGA